MQDIVRAAMRAGAIGFSTSESPTHFFGSGVPVPSRVAPREEIVALGCVLGEFGRGLIEIAPYLSKLCEALSDSVIGESRPISLKVQGAGGHLSSRQAVSIGLVVTELVLNSLKHAFPPDTRAGQIVVAYEIAGANWKLSIADNGIGVPQDGTGPSKEKKSGLGTSIVKALAQQLEAQVEVSSGPKGTTVSLTHGTLVAGLVTGKDHRIPAQAPFRPRGPEISPVQM